MGILSALKWVSRAVTGLVTRSFESAKTTRLNSAHWRDAQGATVNQELRADLATIRNRCEYESQENGTFDGAIETMVVAIVGECGPILQVTSSDEEYNRALEKVWQEWFELPDAAGQLSGIEMLNLCVRHLCTAGEYILVKSYEETVDGPWLRLSMVHPRRLKEMPGRTDAPLGIVRDEKGRPKAYLIEETDEFTGRYKMAEYPADQVIHKFRFREAGQIRGVPLFYHGLTPAGELRDFTDQVMDAMRAAADHAIVMVADHPDMKFAQVNEISDFQRRSITYAPPGYKPEQLDPKQPGTNWEPFNKQRLSDIGRGANMPGMMVRLDSSDHNYSSARFDGQIFGRTGKRLQVWIGADPLTPLCKLLATEEELAGRLGPRPKDLKIGWIWPVQPHVDPEKEANADGLRVKDGSKAPSDVAAGQGVDFEEVCRRRERDGKTLKRYGLPVPWEVIAPPVAGTPPAPPATKPDDPNKADEEEQDDDANGD